MPHVDPPSGGALVFLGGGGNQGGGHFIYHSEAGLSTELDLAGVGNHYSQQLEQAGWTPVDIGQAGPFAWSAWTFQDENGGSWNGLFTVFDRKTTPRLLSLQLFIIQVEEQVLSETRVTAVATLPTAHNRHTSARLEQQIAEPPIFSTHSTGTEHADETAALQALIIRLLEWPISDEAPEPARLLTGQASQKLSDDIPIPGDSLVLGSFENGWGEASVAFETDLTPETVIDFYNERMKSAGWSEPAPVKAGGFLPSPSRSGGRYSAHLCRGRHGPALIVTSRQLETGHTHVILNLHIRHHPCDQANTIPSTSAPGMLPPLVSPPDAGLTWLGAGGGGSGGLTNVQSEASLSTELDLASVGNHYSQQLGQAGWTPVEAGLASPFAWSTWTFQDENGEPWNGLFTVFDRKTTPRQLLLQIRAEQGLDEPRPPARDLPSGNGEAKVPPVVMQTGEVCCSQYENVRPYMTCALFSPVA